MTGGWRIGVDVGGTFTDVAALHPNTGEVRTAKVRSPADDPVQGLLAALAAVGLSWPEADDLVHGTTLITNAIVEGRLATVALVATEGFGDTLAIGRQNRRHLYRLDLPPKLEPLVPTDRRFEVSERVAVDGTVVAELSEAAADEVVRRVAASGAETAAVSLLHAYANAEHEERLGRALRGVVANVALSHRVNPEAREYERTATTVLSAAVMPRAARYLDRLEEQRPRDSRLHLFHSAGGMGAPAVLRELPLGLALSGPAAGVAAAARVARELGLDHALSFDMGGTTTDVCLISGGQAEVRSDRSINGRPMRQPMIAVETIGAGGGSIARLDHGVLKVGPKSAGADPGPACYGRGGTVPTVSDANLVLGYLDPDRQLGDSIHLDEAAARAALTPLAGDIDTTLAGAALGICRVANAAMARALGRVTVERGVDGRRCTLIAFGGAGPMHAAELARGFGIRRVIVPAHSSVFSAVGCADAGLSYSQQQTVRMTSTAWNPERLRNLRDALLQRLSAPLADGGGDAGDLSVEDVASVRYSGQSYAVEVPLPALDDPESLGQAFRDRHEVLYGFAPDEPWELVSLRLTVSRPETSGRAVTQAVAANRAEPVSTRPSCFGLEGEAATPRFDRAHLAGGQNIPGPAIIEDQWSTIVVPPGATLTPDAAGHLHMDVEPAA